MEIGHFYYIDDQYFKDFPDPYLMQNKEKVNGQLHDRPCFYAFQDSNTQLFWMIPFSSQVSKFKGIYNKKMQKYHRCDTIVFGEVLGHEKAFLIQNMCPITEKYMKNEYLDSAANIPVRVDGRLEKELKDKAGNHQWRPCRRKKRHMQTVYCLQENQGFRGALTIAFVPSLYPPPIFEK